MTTSTATSFQLMTSLAEISSYRPCASGWRAIIAARSKYVPAGACFSTDTTLFPLIECCDSNTFGDVCWLLGKREGEVAITVNTARACADSVAHLQNGFSMSAASYANTAASYAVSDCAVYAAAATAGAADAAVDAAAVDAAANPADAAIYAAYAAIYAAYAAKTATHAADDAIYAQHTKNMDFLRQAIRNFEARVEALLAIKESN